MKNIFLHIIVRAWSLFVATSTTWDVIASENESQLNLRKRYVFPWVILCMLTVLVFDGLYATENWFEIGFLNAIIIAVSYGGGYFLSNSICFWYLRKQQVEINTARACETIVSYSFTAIFLLKILTTALPSLFFLKILSIYTAYLVWEGCRSVLKLNEEERGNIVLVFTAIIIFVPVLISRIIYFILPNA